MFNANCFILQDRDTHLFKCDLAEGRAMTAFLRSLVFPPVMVPKDGIAAERSAKPGKNRRPIARMHIGGNETGGEARGEITEQQYDIRF